MVDEAGNEHKKNECSRLQKQKKFSTPFPQLKEVIKMYFAWCTSTISTDRKMFRLSPLLIPRKWPFLLEKLWSLAVVLTLCNATKKMMEKKLNCSYKDDGVPNYAIFFWKFLQKMAKICSFLKLALWLLEKKIFKIFFQLLKVKIP